VLYHANFWLLGSGPRQDFVKTLELDDDELMGSLHWAPRLFYYRNILPEEDVAELVELGASFWFFAPRLTKTHDPPQPPSPSRIRN